MIHGRFLRALLGMLLCPCTALAQYPFEDEDLPTPRAIVEQAIEAHGGVLLRLKGGVQFDAFHESGRSYIRLLADREGRYLSWEGRKSAGYVDEEWLPKTVYDITYDFDIVRSYVPGRWKLTRQSGSDGVLAWIQADGINKWAPSPYNGILFTRPSALEHVFARVLVPWAPVDLLDSYSSAETRAAVEFDGEQCWRIRLEAADGRRDVAYFSQESGFLRGFAIGTRADGSQQVLLTMDDYQDFGGIWVAQSIARDAWQLQITDFSWLVPEKEAFRTPVPPPPSMVGGEDEPEEAKVLLEPDGTTPVELGSFRGERPVVLLFVGDNGPSMHAIMTLAPLLTGTDAAIFAVCVDGRPSDRLTQQLDAIDGLAVIPDFGQSLSKRLAIGFTPLALLVRVDGTLCRVFAMQGTHFVNEDGENLVEEIERETSR